jgi:ABC-type lipoprotein release transport system permease subunit
MRARILLKRNLAYYWRTNLAVIFGVAIAVAVLVGALLVGESVRASLRDIFLLRLGRADHVISTASTFFREQLAVEIQSHEQFASNGFNGVCPMIVLSGSVTHEESGRRGAGVQVYGVDERFWKFHEREGVTAPQHRETLLSESLSRELGIKAGDVLLLRVEKPSTIPAESLHGRKDDLGRTVRLSVRGALGANEMGEFSVRPQQTEMRAVFVPLRLLQKELEQDGRVNTLLVSVQAAKEDTGTPPTQAKNVLLQKILKDKISLEDMGIRLRALSEQGQIALETESAIINDALAETARQTAAALNFRVSPVSSYLANTIRAGQRELPYSIITAIDDESFEGLRRAQSAQASALQSRSNDAASPPDNVSTSQLSPILLNEWAARELEIRSGETVTLQYYLWQEGGRLLTREAQFQLAGVVPIKDLAADRNLVPEYPGITGAESLSDWDPPFPVDLTRIQERDEDYWDQYRTTPKAFIPLAKGQELWQSRFGKLTSIRLKPLAGAELQASLAAYSLSLREAIDPAQIEIVVYPARAQGLEASRGTTDFGEYFLYFSFFLVASALLLAALFFRLGVEQRLREIGTLQAIGFPAAKIRALFLTEGVLLATTGTLLGLAGALAYGSLMMKGLRTWWVGATGTTMLGLHVSPSSLLLGSLGGLVAASLCIVWTLRRMASVSTRSLLTGTLSKSVETVQAHEARIKSERGRGLGATLSSGLFNASRAGLIFTVLGLALLLAAVMNLIGQAAAFFGGGTALLVALLCYQSLWLRRKGKRLIQGRGWWSVSRLGFRNATHRPGRSILCIALIASAAFIIVSVDAFRRDDKRSAQDKKSGSGGYPLLAESLLPLVHDPNTPEGREALNLMTGDDGAAALERIAFTRFRVRPGDDASCLNLYQPRNPKVIAPTDDFLRSSRFSFQDALAQTPEEKSNPWLLLNKETVDGAIPVIADANSLTYVLHLKLGDVLSLDEGDGKPAQRLRIVAVLSDSIFQSELLMSESNFLRLFPEQEGYRFFLLDTSEVSDSNRIAATLEESLSDYGFDVVETGERLASFHRVENTFISTFQMLGGLGLVLGTLGLGAVLLRNVLERRSELALLRAVGYNSAHFSTMIVAENAFLLFCGLLTGFACALLAISPVIFSRGGQLPTVSLGLLLLGVLAAGLAASLLAAMVAIRSPLLAALRAE